MSILEIELCCRFCAQTITDEEEMIQFSHNQEVFLNCSLILDYFKINFINLTEEDNLPKRTCEQCYQSMLQAYKFFKKLEHCQQLLRKCINDYPNYNARPAWMKSESYFPNNHQNRLLKEEPTERKKILDTCLFPGSSTVDADAKSSSNSGQIQTNSKKLSTTNFKSKTNKSLPCKQKRKTPCKKIKNLQKVNISRQQFEVEKYCRIKEGKVYRWECSLCNVRQHSEQLLESHIKQCSVTEPSNDTNEEKTNLNTLLDSQVNLKRFNDKTLSQLVVSGEDSDDSLSSVGFDEPIEMVGAKIPPQNKIIKSWEDYPWICRKCLLSFPTANGWRSHNKLKHKRCSSLLFRCFDCTSRFRHYSTFHGFIAHVGYHRPYLSVQCYHCLKNFDTNDEMTSHVCTEHESKYSCKLCGETFNSGELQQEHKQKYDLPPMIKKKKGAPVSIEELTCKICNKLFKTKITLKNHMYTTHNTEQFACDKCGQLYNNKIYLRIHMKIHESDKYECDICKRLFARKPVLILHIKNHMGIIPKLHTCDVCQQKYPTKCALKKHKIKHSTSTPFVCEICNKAFKCAQYLKIHESRHIGTQEYKCKYCDKLFTNQSNRRKHVIRLHESLK